MVRFYYTLGDISKFRLGTTVINVDDPFYYKFNATGVGFLGWIRTEYAVFDDRLDTSFGPDTTITKTLGQNYIFPRYFAQNIMYSDVYAHRWDKVERPDKFDDNFDNSTYLNLLGRIWEGYGKTSQTYGNLITMYENELTHLMDKIESTSTSKFNDTPQDGGNFDTDTHTTNSTRVVASTDGASKINRLDEIKNKLISIYSEGTDSFGRTFIIED